MSKRYSGRKIIRTLEKADFYQISQKGSHVKLRGLRKGQLRTAIVPDHKEVAIGTFHSILQQAAMTREEFESYL